MIEGNRFEGRFLDGIVDEGTGSPPVISLNSSVDLLLHTSVEEGFGLTFLEAAAGSTPFLCRELPDVFEDFNRWGMEFPMSYKELEVPLDLLDVGSEIRRQERIRKRWLKVFPEGLVGKYSAFCFMDILQQGGQWVPFSRLSLKGQVEVLRALPRGIGSLRKQVPNAKFEPPDVLRTEHYARQLSQIFEAAQNGEEVGGAVSKWGVVKERALDTSRLFPLLLEAGV